jgi:hypothetical protein
VNVVERPFKLGIVIANGRKALPRIAQGKKRKAKEGSTKARQPIGMCMDEGYLSYYFIHTYILNNMYKHILVLNDFWY